MHEFLKTKRNFSTTLLMFFIFFLGIYIGKSGRLEIEKVNSLTGKEVAVDTRVDFSPFWKVWNTMDAKSPDRDKITDQDKVYGAISGLVGSLDDPYTIFLNPDEAKAFQEEIAGNFTGVGMEIGIKNKVLTVITPLKNTPAEKAGILAGDQVLKIDKTLTLGLDVDKAIKLIRGEKGTTVTLTIFRAGFKEPKEIKIVRDVINVPILDFETRPDGIFLVQLYSFSENSADLFRKAMIKFSESGSKKLILDLRGNPGGYLDAAVDISSWFLPAGKVVVTEDYGKNQKPKAFRSKGYNSLSGDLQIVILINAGSASASEIVAGALQDQGVALLVGEQSFGKGSVQEVVDVTSDTLLKITVAKWLTPNGHLIHEIGLTPDYKVERTAKDIENKKDPQMDKAVELLLKNESR